MLRELIIRQLAIIQDLRIEFNHGLNILTGETGAGKSIIIDAIQLITGGRGSVEYIRSTSEKAEIEALFDLPLGHKVFQTLVTLGLESPEDGMLLFKRELLRTGKNVCRINGQLVTLSMLKEVGEDLIQLHSQHQHQQLLHQDKQLSLLDAYGDKEVEEQKEKFVDIYLQYESVKKEAKKLAENEKEIAQRIDLLQYQIKEISQAKLKPDEDDELLKQRDKIRHAEKITNGFKNAYVLLNDENGIVFQMGNVIDILDQIKAYDEKISLLYEQIVNAYYQVEDAAMQLNSQVDSLEFDQEQINSIEVRLSLIHHLKRKYGENVNSVLEYAVTIEEELDLLIHRDEHLQDIQERLKKVIKELKIEALALSNLRKKTAEQLSASIENELRDLQMKNVKFQVNLSYQEDKDGLEVNGNLYQVTQTGLDRANFLISPNPGEPLKPINKIASGGELSRVMLAIQNILANKDDITSIIFDEIDTGVSGRTAQAIAEKLAFVAGEKQVFAVTHLPQAASMADHHYLIKKSNKENSTYTTIEYLDEEKRIEELARMLGGVEVTELTKKHAREMIEKTLPIKSQR